MAVKNAEPETKNLTTKRFILFVVVAILVIAAVAGAVKYQLPSVIQASYGPGPVEIEVATDKLVYLRGEKVNVTVYVTNPQNWPVEKPWSIDIEVGNGTCIDGCGINIDYAPDRIPAFAAHSTESYWDHSWSQKIYVNKTFTQVQVEPGVYTITVRFDGRVDYGTGGNCTFEIR